MFKPELPKCTGCNETKETKPGQWWHLSSYFGISGFFCPSCYDQVAHDAYGTPKNPPAYQKILDRFNNNVKEKKTT